MRNLLIASTIAAAVLGSAAPQAVAGTYEAWGHTFVTGDADVPFAGMRPATIRLPGDDFKALAPRHHQRRVSLPLASLTR